MSVNFRAESGLSRPHAPAPADASGAGRKRVLLVGQSPLALETVLAEVEALDFEAAGSAQPERAVDTFDAANFDLIALGAGLAAPMRAFLKRGFTRQSPDIRIIDTIAPRAARDIAAALSGSDPALDLPAYFARIGFKGLASPDLATLRRLQELHPDAIPFEAMDVLLHRGVDVSPEAVEAKLVAGGRGGYCFEQNGLFLRALQAIGFAAEGRLARVRWGAAPGAAPASLTHMAVQVTLDNIPWLADVGFGGSAPPEPLRMDITAPQTTRHGTYRLIPFGPALLLQFRMDGEWTALYEIEPQVPEQADYETGNWRTSTHPDSHFRSQLSVARTTPEARHTLKNALYTVRAADGRMEKTALDADGLAQVLKDIFRLPVAADWRPALEGAAAATAREEADHA